MDFDSVRIALEDISKRMQKLLIALKYEEKLERIEKITKLSLEEDFYLDKDKSSKLLQEQKNLERSTQKIKNILVQIDDAKGYLELAEEMNDQESFKEAEKISKILNGKLEKLEIETLLDGEYDSNNAIITIHPGAGGTESQDWAEMLYRMYLKWASRNEYEIEVLDFQSGDEAGIKSVSFLVKGDNAYGYLKSENGVHRLVRISPFDANSRRHTSFAAVEVIPEIDDSIKIDISPEEIEMDVFRASGAGGQHVNKTSSAVRLKHIPTGIVVSCQTERSQFQNRDYAMKMLKSKLYKLEQENNRKKLEGIKGKSSDNAFGSQIRSYVFCPYTLVKDHRTGYEIGNIEGVMDGKIDDFLYEYLKYIKKDDIIWCGLHNLKGGIN